MSSLTGDGAPKDLRKKADAEDRQPLTEEQRDRIAALKAEIRSARRADVPDKHSEEL